MEEYHYQPSPDLPGCCKCYLIDEACFRRILGSRINKNVTFGQMEAGWRIAHDFDIIPLIGLDCYAALCERMSAEGDSGNMQTDADRALLLAIQHYAAWAIYIRILEASPSTQLTQAGLTEIFPDNYQHAGDTTRQSLIAVGAKYRNKYKEDFLSFLRENEPAYPCLPKQDKCKDKRAVYMNFITTP